MENAITKTFFFQFILLKFKHEILLKYTHTHTRKKKQNFPSDIHYSQVKMIINLWGIPEWLRLAETSGSTSSCPESLHAGCTAQLGAIPKPAEVSLLPTVSVTDGDTEEHWSQHWPWGTRRWSPPRHWARFMLYHSVSLLQQFEFLLVDLETWDFLYILFWILNWQYLAKIT